MIWSWLEREKSVSVGRTNGWNKTMVRQNLKNQLCRPTVIFFLVSLLASLIIWGVFAGQALYSDVVTIEYGVSDTGIGSYPGFCKIEKIVNSDMAVVGVDTQTLNGSPEFYLRPNMPNAYIFMYVFAFLGRFMQVKWAYLLFMIFHTFVGMFYAQRLIYKYIKGDIFESILFGFAVCALMIYEESILLWFLIAALLPCVCFMSLEAIYAKGKLKKNIKAVFAFLAAFTSGYMNVSFVMVVVVYLFTVLFYFLKKRLFVFKEWLHYTITVGIAGVMCLPYYLAMLFYVKKTGITSTLADSVFYKFNISDILGIISAWSFRISDASNAKEQMFLMSIGMIGVFILFTGFIAGVYDRFIKMEKRLYTVAMGCFLFMIAWALEDAMPVAYWMYSYVPIIGSMHIPMRWFILGIYLVYIMIGLVYRKIRFDNYKKELKYAVTVMICLAICLIVLNREGIEFSLIFTERFLLELFLLIFFMISLIKRGKKSYVTLFVWGFSLLYPAVILLYGRHAVSATYNEVQSSNIYYNETANKNLDVLIKDIGKKEIYKYACMGEDLIFYTLENYPWMYEGDSILSNYMGYALHLNAPKEYLEHFPWFDRPDWRYIVDTRAEFVILDAVSYEKNEEVLNRIIDAQLPSYDMGNGRTAYRLKKYIPSYITGEQYLEDETDVFDNGYFYSQNLTDKNIVDFHTDDTSYYSITIDTDKETLMGFLMYANSNYKYYIDGHEFIPDIYNGMQAFFSAPVGTHTIEIRYENKLAMISKYIFIYGYILLGTLYIAVVIYDRFYKKRKRIILKNDQCMHSNV